MYFQYFKKMAGFLAIAIFFVALDRFLKILAMQGYQFKALGEILKFKYQANYYIAFSLPLSGAWLNSIIGLIILLLIFYWIHSGRAGQPVRSVTLSLIALGAASNLFDRLNYGYVIDYFDLKYFTVFNLADIMIIAGVAGLLLTLKFKGKSYE